MRKPHIIALLFAASVAVFASSHPETLGELKQRAAAAKPGDQPRLFLEVAERQLQAAHGAYEQDKPETGRVAVEEAAAYCEKAAAAAVNSQKYLKQSEIRVRDMIRSLDALRHTLPTDDRAPVQTAIDRLEKVRSDLLAAMFGAKT